MGVTTLQPAIHESMVMSARARVIVREMGVFMSFDRCLI